MESCSPPLTGTTRSYVAGTCRGGTGAPARQCLEAIPYEPYILDSALCVIHVSALHSACQGGYFSHGGYLVPCAQLLWLTGVPTLHTRCTSLRAQVTTQAPPRYYPLLPTTVYTIRQAALGAWCARHRSKVCLEQRHGAPGTEARCMAPKQDAWHRSTVCPAQNHGVPGTLEHRHGVPGTEGRCPWRVGVSASSVRTHGERLGLHLGARQRCG